MTAHEPDAAPAAVMGTRDTWISFTDLAVWSFVLYGLGIATPYLQKDLHLTAFEAGLHGSALAIGVLIAGVVTDRVARLVGMHWLPDLEVAIIGLGIALFALAPSLPVSLAGAMLMGLGGSILSTDNNVRLGRVKGEGSRRLLAQAYGLSMIMAGAAPLAIGLAAAHLATWRVAMAIPVAVFVLLAFLRSRESEPPTSVVKAQGSLTLPYWVAVLVIALSVSIEFSFVYWGSSMVGRRAGIASSDATLMASLFVVGMFLGRTAVGRGLGAGRSPRTLLAAGLIVAMIGACVVWISPIAALSGLGLLLGGLGTAALFPVGLTVALHAAPNAQMTAMARTALAVGLALLVVPSTLGLVSDAIGLIGAWAIIPAIALAALAVVATMPGSEKMTAQDLAASAEAPPLGELPV
jgi:MFS family permease